MDLELHGIICQEKEIWIPYCIIKLTRQGFHETHVQEREDMNIQLRKCSVTAKL